MAKDVHGLGKFVPELFYTPSNLGRMLNIAFKKWNGHYEWIARSEDEYKHTSAWNANLARYEIIELKGWCQKYLSKEDYPAEYFIKTPPLINEFEYMTEKQRIWHDSKKSIAA